MTAADRSFEVPASASSAPPWRAPRAELDAETAWVLAAAFAPMDRLASEARPLADPSRAADLLRRLGLAARAVDRLGFDQLRVALGPEAARRLAVDHAAAEARSQQILDLARDLATLDGAPPMIFLKLAGLCLAGHSSPAARAGADLDVLVAESAASGLFETLRRDGFVPSSIPEYDHQLPALAHPRRGVVEIHTHVPGVRLQQGSDTKRFARLEDVLRSGEQKTIPGFPPNAATPSVGFLAAHAVVHGLAQHRGAPGSYPLFQMVADLRDLVAEGSATLAAPTWITWIERDVSVREARAVLALGDELASGKAPGEGDSRALLDHILVGTLDPRYRIALKAEFSRPLSESWWPLARLRVLRRALFPSGAELVAIYGAPRGALGILRLRLRRPFDAAARYVRARRAVAVE
ncbi:MAG: nucleotidyltransferase family protein [Acidobacteriota bacterium]